MIVALSKDNIQDLNKPNQPFEVIGKLDITYKSGEWQSKEVLFDTVAEKQYPDYDGAAPHDYIDSDDRIAYLAYKNGECVGQILIAKAWNKYAHIEDISVAKAYRRKGIGTALLHKACEWAKAKSLCGISLESQDNNVIASRFYAKHGMQIGSVNTNLYRHIGAPYNTETAVFWYLDINK